MCWIIRVSGDAFFHQFWLCLQTETLTYLISAEVLVCFLELEVVSEVLES